MNIGNIDIHTNIKIGNIAIIELKRAVTEKSRTGRKYLKLNIKN